MNTVTVQTNESGRRTVRFDLPVIYQPNKHNPTSPAAHLEQPLVEGWWGHSCLQILHREQAGREDIHTCLTLQKTDSLLILCGPHYSKNAGSYTAVTSITKYLTSKKYNPIFKLETLHFMKALTYSI